MASIDTLNKEPKPMNSAQINLVQSTFAEIRPVSVVAAELFYARLFELDPTLRPLFKGDLTHQGRMLLSLLGAAVSGLTNIELLAPIVQRLGAHHIHYGVQDEHYATVGTALLWTLEQCLGKAFTPDVRDAWTTAYALLADAMQLGAKEAKASQRWQLHVDQDSRGLEPFKLAA